MAQAQSRQIRVFISSTFRDMQAERDYLVKYIFPQLRRLCEQRAVTWGEVDLRWGITEEQSKEGQVLPICIAEIERCRPYFIGLLGERYGWVPDAIDPDLLAREAWLSEHLQHSVTELEILHGVLNNPEMAERTLFYFRDPAFIQSLDPAILPDFTELPSPDEIAQFGDDGAQARADERRSKLAALKERIRASGLPLQENYANPKELGEWVLRDMTAMIDALFPPGSVPDALEQEAQLHEAFARSRTQLYIGGEQYYPQVDAHMRASRLPLVVVGESGSGKSALLANWALRYQQAHPDELVLTHFIGASPASADLAAMLRRLMTGLKRRFELSDEVPTDEQQLSAAFPNWLYMAAAKGSFTLVLDALNQLEERLGARGLHWLPNELPENMQLLLSTLPGPALDAALEKKWPTITVQALSLEERRQLTREFLAQYAKELTDKQIDRIVNDPQSKNPLGLRLLLDELRQFGSHESLEAEMQRYLEANSIPELFDRVLARLERDYEAERPNLVREALSLLWAARRGLSEAELLDMLGSPDLPLPQAIWAPLSLALGKSFFERAGLLNFFHDFIRQAVQSRYLPSGDEQDAAHLKLADYFARQEGYLPHKLEELPWQLLQARAWKQLNDLLADVRFFEALYESNEQEVSLYWAAVEANTTFKRTEAYQGALKQGLPFHVLNWLSLNFKDAGYFQEAWDLLKAQERICHELKIPYGLYEALGAQANILYRWGRLEEAMALYQEGEQYYRDVNDPFNLMIFLNGHALILSAWGRLDEAMDLHKEEERICRQLENQRGLSISLGNQANILCDLHKFDEAMSLLKEQESLCRQTSFIDGLQSCLGNQALIFEHWNKFDEAMDFLQQQEHLCRQLGNRDGLCSNLNSQALILCDEDKLDDAMRLLEEQENISRELNNPKFLSICLVDQGVIWETKGDREKFVALLLEALSIAQEYELVHLIEQIEGILNDIWS